MTEDDRALLLAFVDSTRRDIELAVRYLPEDDGSVNRLANEAWAPVRAREFRRIRDAIISGTFDEELDAAGLSDIQLHFKLEVVRVAREGVAEEERRARRAPEPPDTDLDGDDRRPRRFRVLRRRIRKLLDAIDVVLDSLVGALHGVGEMLQEFKKALKAWLED